MLIYQSIEKLKLRRMDVCMVYRQLLKLIARHSVLIYQSIEKLKLRRMDVCMVYRQQMNALTDLSDISLTS